MRTWAGALLVAATLAAAAAAAVVFAGAAFGRTAASVAGCRATIDQLDAYGTSDTTAQVVARVSSASGGSWQIHISSPETTTVGGSFSGPEDTISVGFSSLIPHTHYRGTLSVSGDCGGDSAEIDFRTPESPPRSTCAAAPSVDGLQVGSVALDSAVVGYTVSSPDGATVDLSVSPGGAASSTQIAGPGGSGQLPLGGLTPNTPYTVTLRARNGCGETVRTVAFTTLRASDCSGPPVIEGLRVAAVDDRAAVLAYQVRSDGVGTLEIVVNKTKVDSFRHLSGTGSDSGRVPVPGLTPGTRFLVSASADNACGHAAAVLRFSSLARVAVDVNGPGRVTSAPRGISCGKDCSGTYTAGKAVRLFARPEEGSRFTGWGGACHGTARVCTLKAGNDLVTAAFARKT